MSVSREEAVALGEGVTAGRLCVREWSVFAATGWDSTHPVTAVAHCYGPADAHLFAAAPRLRETVVELHDRVAELEAELCRLRAEAVAASNKNDGMDSWRLRHSKLHVDVLIRDGVATREALGVDCALNELPAHAAALRAENERLQRDLGRAHVVLGEHAIELASLRAHLPNRRADLCTDAEAVRKMLDALPPGISRQSGEARLAEVQRQIEEETP